MSGYRLHRLRNGDYVQVPNDITPEGLRRLESGNTPRQPEVRRATPPRDEGRERRIAARAHTDRAMANIGPFGIPSIRRGVLLNFDDEIAGAVGAVTSIPRAIANRDIREVGRGYRQTRDDEREYTRRRREASPIAETVGEIGGAIASPIGTGVRTARALGRFVPQATRVADRIARARPTTQAALAGTNEGAVNAVGASHDSNLLGAAGEGALYGGVGGAAIGGAVNAGRRLRQTLRDARPENADRVASERVGQMLERAPRYPGSPMRHTPETVERELRVSRGRGTDARVGDISPETQMHLAASARNPRVNNSNDVRYMGEQRQADRPQAIEDEVRRAINPSTGQDAIARRESIVGARRKHGQDNYDDVLDAPIAWNDELQTFITKDNPLVRRVRARAENLAKIDDLDPTTSTTVGPRMTSAEFRALMSGDSGARPTMRVFDYMKRGFDAEMRHARGKGDNNLARMAHDQLEALKAGIARANPEYEAVLAGQRSFYAMEEAVTTGESMLRRLVSEPRKLFTELSRHGSNNNLDDARTGFVEAILSTRNQRGTPLTRLRNISKSPDQRRVLSLMFGGNAQLSKFERYLARESRSDFTDTVVRRGGQSITNDLAQAGNDIGPGQKVLESGVRGFGFGGIVGGIGNTIASLRHIGTSNEAKAEMARILMGTGDGLADGVRGARRYYTRQRDANRRVAAAAGKAGSQLFSGEGGH